MIRGRSFRSQPVIGRACEAGESVKPGVERSGTPGLDREKIREPAKRATAFTLKVNHTNQLPPAPRAWFTFS